MPVRKIHVTYTTQSCSNTTEQSSIDGTTLDVFVWLTRIVTAEKRLIRATTLLSRVGDIFFQLHE